MCQNDIKNINDESRVEKLSNVVESNFQIDQGMLVRYEGHDTDVVIPDGVTKIGNDSSSVASQ